LNLTLFIQPKNFGKMKKYAILCFFTFTTIALKAQIPTQAPSNVIVEMPQTNFFSLSDEKAIENMPLLVGKERFFSNDSIFRKGELVTKKRHYTTELGYRFDQIERALEVQFESGNRLILDDKDIVLFVIFYDDYMTTFIPLLLPKEQKKVLVQVIYKTPTLQLFRDVHKTTKRIVDNQRNADYHDQVKNDYHYYFRENETSPLVEIEMKAKSFAKVLPLKQSKIYRLFAEEEEKGKLTISKICKIMEALDDRGK
jgi:hypothetical protein